MQADRREQIAAFVRNIIAPGGRAFFPYELDQAIRAAAAESEIELDGRPVRLGEFWDEASADPDRKRKIKILKEVCKQMHGSYSGGAPVEYESRQSLAYMLHYLPMNLHKVQFILLDMFRAGMLPDNITALDIGTGVGTVPLAVTDFYELLKHAHALFGEPFAEPKIAFRVVDGSSENLSRFQSIRQKMEQAGSTGCQCRIREQTSEVRLDGGWRQKLPANARYNFVFMANFLNELRLSPAQRAEVVRQSAKLLSEDGMIVLIEPADQLNSKAFHAVQAGLVRHRFEVLFPCGGAAGNGGCANCWSFRRETLKVPEFMRPLQFKSDDPDEPFKWTYAVLRPARGAPTTAANMALTPLRSLMGNGARAETVRARVVSPLLDGDKVKLCGAEWDSRVALLEVGQHQALPPLDHGETVELENVLVRPGSKGEFPSEIRLLFDAQADARVPSKPSPQRMQIADTSLTREALRYFLRRLFGFTDFRTGQETTIARMLAGQDTLTILATSAGKSLCFQLPAMLLPGTAVVVSPLLSLVQDQIHGLRTRFDIDQVERINGELSKSEKEEALDKLVKGHYKLVYITPEQLTNARVLGKLKEAARRHGISLFAVDEVHCLSQWGHDFRPAYLSLHRRFAEIDAETPERPPTPVLALTATASEKIIDDIKDKLHLPPDAVQRHSFDRPELSFEVVQVEREPEGEAQRMQALLDVLRQRIPAALGGAPHTPGIIFVLYTGHDMEKTSDRWLLSAEGLAKWLQDNDIRAERYHSELSDEQRWQVQSDFMQGEFDVLVATKGFGMGIDMPNIRFVINFVMADSLESYYQQAGRAGRDGGHSHCVLIHQNAGGASASRNASDYGKQLYFIEQSYSFAADSEDKIRDVFSFLYGKDVTTYDSQARAIYQDVDDLLLALGWLSAQELELAKQRPKYVHDEIRSAWQRIIKGWRKAARVSEETVAEQDRQVLLSVTPAADTAAIDNPWNRLLRDSGLSPHLAHEARTLLTNLLGGPALGQRRVVAIAQRMKAALTHAERADKRRSDKLTELKQVLESLYRMGFVESWRETDTKVTYWRKRSWEQTERETREPLVRHFLTCLKADAARGSVWSTLRADRESEDLIDLSSRVGLSVEELMYVLDHLKAQKLISSVKYTHKRLMVRFRAGLEGASADDLAVELDQELERLHRQYESQLQMLDHMQSYIDTRDCRRQSIVGYFLQQEQQRIIVRCNFCDNCCPEGIHGERAAVEEATRRQVAQIEVVRAWLEHDFVDPPPCVEEDVKEVLRHVGELRPQANETPTWDLVRGICEYHRENRRVGSWRAALLARLLDSERGRKQEQRPFLDRLEQQTHDWTAVDLIAAELLACSTDQYAVIEKRYECARQLGRPFGEQARLLEQLLDIDYDRSPALLFDYGQGKLLAGDDGWQSYVADALDRWLKTGDFAQITAGTQKAFTHRKICEALLPAWIQQVLQRFGARSLLLLDTLAANVPADASDAVVALLQSVLAALPPMRSACITGAAVAEKLGNLPLACELLEKALELPPDEPHAHNISLHEVHAKLAEIHKQDRSAAGSEKRKHHLLAAAHTAGSAATSLGFYRDLVEKWTWQRLEEEIRWLDRRSLLQAVSPPLVLAWQASRKALPDSRLLAYLAENDRWRTHWTPEQIAPILRAAAQSELERYPALEMARLELTGDRYFQDSENLDYVNAVTQLVLRGATPSAETLRACVSKLMSARMPAANEYERRWLTDPAQRSVLFNAMHCACPLYHVDHMVRWLRWFDDLISDELAAERLQHLDVWQQRTQWTSLQKRGVIRIVEMLSTRPALKQSVHSLFVAGAAYRR